MPTENENKVNSLIDVGEEEGAEGRSRYSRLQG